MQPVKTKQLKNAVLFFPGRYIPWKARRLELFWLTCSLWWSQLADELSYQRGENFAFLWSKLLFQSDSWPIFHAHSKKSLKDIPINNLVWNALKSYFSFKLLTFNWYLNFKGFQVSPLRYSIHVWTVSGAVSEVSLMCFKDSSRSTSPQGSALLTNTFLFKRLLRRIPARSNSIRPRRASSIKMQPEKYLYLQ